MRLEKPPSPKVPRKYGGLFIAWNHQQTQIIASGKTLPEAIAAAKATGEERPIFAKAPRAAAERLVIFQMPGATRRSR